MQVRNGRRAGLPARSPGRGPATLVRRQSSRSQSSQSSQSSSPTAVDYSRAALPPRSLEIPTPAAAPGVKRKGGKRAVAGNNEFVSALSLLPTRAPPTDTVDTKRNERADVAQTDASDPAAAAAAAAAAAVAAMPPPASRSQSRILSSQGGQSSIPTIATTATTALPLMLTAIAGITQGDGEEGKEGKE